MSFTKKLYKSHLIWDGTVFGGIKIYRIISEITILLPIVTVKSLMFLVSDQHCKLISAMLEANHIALADRDDVNSTKYIWIYWLKLYFLITMLVGDYEWPDITKTFLQQIAVFCLLPVHTTSKN